jgi:hypothetical protein
MRTLKQPTSSVGTIEFGDFVAEPRTGSPANRKPKPLARRDFVQLLHVTNDMKERQAWAEFKPRNLVALYCLLHGHVYGVTPEEVRDHFAQATRTAKAMLEHEFDGDAGRMIEFMRWVWSREMNKLKTRDVSSDFRIGWRLQFARTMMSDYRVARARKGRKVQ